MRIITFSLGAAAALMLVVAASASASSFLSSAKEKLLTLDVSPQVFVSEAGTLECTEMNVISGESSGTETTELTATVKYEGCIAFGFVTVTTGSPEYVFLADKTIHLVKLFGIQTVGCEVSYPAQLLNNVDYKNSTTPSGLLMEWLVTGMLYSAAGIACRKTGHFSNGTYKGHDVYAIPKGTISFMP